ncbi:MAG: hypothetical protein IJJ57_01180 [Ruminococcus sp.]|nr:hypothetical protein [Ruminococcus sp.]
MNTKKRNAYIFSIAAQIFTLVVMGINLFANNYRFLIIPFIILSISFLIVVFCFIKEKNSAQK